MAAVIGFTKERMLEIENTCITSGAVVLNDLILTQRDGTQINAGNVRGPQGIQGLAATIESASASGLAAGAAPTVTLGGTPQQRIFTFGIPKGDKGDKGDQGLRGIQGIQGVDGVQGSAASPAGTIALWGSDVAPANWLICDGSAVSRTTYASLFAIIGTKYGAGDGVNTFNLPNLKGQTPIGKDAAQTEFAALNQKGGEKAHLLSATESGLPAHNHTQQAHNHIQDGHYHHVGASGAGSGTPDVWMNQEIAQSTWAGWAFNVDGTGGGARRLVAGTVVATNQAATALNNANAAANAASAHNILQPYTVVNFIIKVTNGDTPGDSQLTQRVSTVESWMGQTPAGTVTIWGGDTAPTNWLLCDGSAISRTTYASLFAVIGTKYGAGDGSTTFNLPNLKGRSPIGLDTSQVEFNAMGKTGGEKTHTLTTAEMPSHTHTDTGHNHGIEASTQPYPGGLAGSVYFGPQYPTHTGYGGIVDIGRAALANTGGGGAHNVLHPYQVVNFIIKFTNGDTQGDSQLTQRVSAMETTKTQTIVDRARWQRLLTGGGMRKVVAGGVSWQERFIVLGAQTADMPSGFMEIWMPPNGTVIPVHGDTTTPTQTVANGLVPMKDWYSLYYEFIPGATYAQDYSKFHLVSHNSAQTAGFVVPNNWIFICTRNADVYSPFYTWGDGRSQDYWRAMGLLNGWVPYNATVWEQPAWKYLDNGDIEIKGLIANGGGTSNISSFPVAYAPLERKIFHVPCSAGMWRVDMDSTGNLISNAAQTAGATNAFVSLAGVHWTPSA